MRDKRLTARAGSERQARALWGKTAQTGNNQYTMILTVKQLEQLEAERLAPYATKSKDSKGRKFGEKRDTVSSGVEKGSGAHNFKSLAGFETGRLCFQKDRDRIIHCKAFRRLDEKAQVFPAFFGDHYRTRLTHTLEVAQISRDIARRLGLNEDLAEAIALAHDLGHPPFGHTGEDALNEIMGDLRIRQDTA